MTDPLRRVSIMGSEEKWYTMFYDATEEYQGDILIKYNLIPMHLKYDVRKIDPSI